MTELLVPLLLTFISLYALIRKQDVYALLLSGAREGLSTLLSIAPSLIVLLTGISMLRSSGFFAWMAQALAPVFRFFGMPPELAPLILVRPVSGSAALAVGAELMKTYGVDSLIGKTAAVMLGSIFTEAAACAALGVMICRDLRGHSPRAGLHMGQRMAKLCLPLAASDYLRSGLRTIEQFLIPWGLMRAGGSYEAAMAEYGMFGGMVFPVLMFPAAFLYALSDLLVPELARSRAEGNRMRVQHLTQKCLRMGLLFAGAVAGGLFALAPWLGQAIYGLDTPGRLLRILSPMVLSLYMDAIVDGMLKGLGEQVSCVRYNTITMAMDVLLLRALLPRFGLTAYLLSFAVTHLVNFALSLRRLLAVTGHAPDIRYAVRALLCTAGAAAAAFSVFGPGLWPILLGRTALFAVSFAGLLRLTGTLERSDTVWLRQALRGH